MSSATFGRAGEDAACAFLKKQGYRIIARNYISGGGELDIVAYKRKTLVFSEVKTRSGTGFGEPAESVGNKKIACLLSAAYSFTREQCFSSRVPVFYPFGITVKRKFLNKRNDIIEVYMSKDKKIQKINHIKGAF